MKYLLIPLLILAAVGLVYEQSQETPNVYLRVGFVLIFMFLLYKLNARIPHKKTNTDESEDVK